MTFHGTPDTNRTCDLSLRSGLLCLRKWTAPYVGRVERGDNNVTALTLSRLATALDISVAKLMQKAGL